MMNNLSKPENIKLEFLLILKEVHQYIPNDTIKKLSLLNKYLREKLKSRLFNRILINGYNLSHLDNYLEYNVLSFNNTSRRDSESILNFKSINIDPFLSELTDIISPLAEYFKSITYYNLDRVGYYVIPTTYNFNRLINLNINTCCLDIKDFNRLMGKLDALERLKLLELYLIKSPDEGFNEEEIKVPSNLKELYLGHNYICSTNLPNTPYEFLAKHGGSIDRSEFYLIPQQFQNLEKFELLNVIENSHFITNLLTSTPKLTHFSLPVLNFSIQIMEMLSENSSIIQLNLKFGFAGFFSSSIKLPVLNYQRTLILLFVIIPSKYLQIYQLIDAFPNLTKLEIELDYYESNFITKLLSKLNKLKVLKLQIFAYSNYIIDLALFAGVKFLKLYDYSNTKIIYKLPNANSKLKTVILFIHNRNNKFKVELVNTLNKTNSNWIFSLQSGEIYCRAANIKQ